MHVFGMHFRVRFDLACHQYEYIVMIIISHLIKSNMGHNPLDIIGQEGTLINTSFPSDVVYK